MTFQVDFQAGKPVYLQLADQIRYAAASGRLRPGEPLPSLRPLAEELRINRNTIAKPYAELENQAFIETLAGKGFFVKQNKSPYPEPVRQRLLLTEIDEAVVTAHHLQVGREKFLALVKERPDYFEGKFATTKESHLIPKKKNNMATEPAVIELDKLTRRYVEVEAVNRLWRTVPAQPC